MMNEQANLENLRGRFLRVTLMLLFQAIPTLVFLPIAIYFISTKM